MNKTQIARKYKKSNSLITDISKHRRFTRNANLALQLAAISGEKGISYIYPDMRSAYGIAYPMLMHKVREEVVIVKRV